MNFRGTEILSYYFLLIEDYIYIHFTCHYFENVILFVSGYIKRLYMTIRA